MGQQLGSGYRGDPSTLPPHTYRLCLAVGVQPDHAKSLLSQEAISGGTAGRFLWTPALTLDRPPRGVRPSDPRPLEIPLPELLRPQAAIGSNGVAAHKIQSVIDSDQMMQGYMLSGS
jgi:hypothetical protein